MVSIGRKPASRLSPPPFRLERSDGCAGSSVADEAKFGNIPAKSSLLERSRNQIKYILHVPDGEVVFTSGGTEANNIAVFGFAHALRSRGNHIITTNIEHPSVLRAMEKLETQGFEVDYLQVDGQGIISIDDLKDKLRKETIFVSIMHVNNEIGSLQTGLEGAVKLLRPGGRLAVITFHSLEDRLVKEFGRTMAREYTFPGEVDVPELRTPRKPDLKLVNRKAITPADREIAQNPRSRSAQLRVMEKT